jgi:hypothetical protein
MVGITKYGIECYLYPYWDLLRCYGWESKKLNTGGICTPGEIFSFWGYLTLPRNPLDLLCERISWQFDG